MERSLDTVPISYPEFVRTAAMTGELRANVVDARVVLATAVTMRDWGEAEKLVRQLAELEEWSVALQETLRGSLRRAGRP